MILLFLLLLILVFLIIEILNIKGQVKEILSSDRSNRLVTVNFPVLGIAGLSREINRLIEKERLLREELEGEKDKIKSQVTSISHDLRTPLTSILGYLELCKSEPKREYIEVIEAKAKGLEKLVETFYEISLLEDKAYDLPLDMVRPSYLIEDMAMGYFDDFKKKGIELKIDINEDREVIGNADELLRVYANLFSNMDKYSNGEAKVFHGMVEGRLKTVFSNDYSGDLEEDKLFVKFYTGEKSRRNTSSGVGLYTAKLLLEKMGHKVSANVKGNMLSIEIEYN
ncbi:MAG: HAMP domain-containing histidine kinase [Tissierellia bacterium]|nr:HAMP domain-containing histidine kinase [Tissierellia bacterium]